MRQNLVSTALACVVASIFLIAQFWAREVNAANEPVSVAAVSPEKASPQEELARGVAHYIMAVNYDLLGMPSEAVSEYEEALRYDDKAFATHLRLGSNYARLGRYQDAVRELKRATEIAPEDLQARYFLALAHSAQRDFPSAAQEYEFILKRLSDQEPRNVELRIYLGQLYFSQGNLEKALAQFEKVYAVEPKNTEIAYLIGNFYLEQNRRVEAEKVFANCVEADPFHDGCLNSLGFMYAEDGKNLDEAQKLVVRALEIDPQNAAYVDSLGWVFFQKGQYVEALKELTRAGEMIKDPIVYDHLGDVHLKLGQPEMARKYWRMSLELDPEQPVVKDKLKQLAPEHVSNLNTQQ